MILTVRWAAAGILAAVMVPSVGAAPAEPAVTALTCTNPSSGFTWQISVDYANRTVDSYPASISVAAISWHNDKDGNTYTLDRASGKLTQVYASSTGGSMLFNSCLVKSSS